MGGVRIAVIGNCQVQTLTLIARHMLDDVSIKVLDYSDVATRDEEVRRRFADDLGDCDHIFTQTALMSHTSERDLRARYGARVVTIGNFYFRGLFPDSCYVGDFGHRLDIPSAVNSIVVLDAFRRGLSEAQALRSFDIEAFHRLGLLDAWSSSMTEMHKREANGTVDVPAAALMEDACRRYPAFLTMNHPAASLLTEYFAQVLRTVGVRFDHVNVVRLQDPLALHDTTPIHDAVAEYLDLPYRTSQNFRINSLAGRFVTLEEYVAHAYAAYRAAPPGTLLLHSPTDLVPALRADPALRYLVDADATAPRDADAAGDARIPLPALPASPLHLAVGALLDGHLRPLTAGLEEVRLFTHKIHSFLEIADPKVESIAQAVPRSEQLLEGLTTLARHPAPPPPPVPVPPPPVAVAGPRRGAALSALAALAGVVLGAALARLL